VTKDESDAEAEPEGLPAENEENGEPDEVVRDLCL